MSLLREMIPDTSWIKSISSVKNEVVAGAIGAMLVIPQAITFSYLAGLPPEFGLYCAIYATFLSSLFGSSMMVGGPNAAVSILLGLAVIPYAGAGSPLYINFILILSFMVGVVQLIMWLVRSSVILQYFSVVSIQAITTGVGILILFYAIDGLIGTTGINTLFFYEKFYITVSEWDGIVNGYAFTVGLVTIIAGLLVKPFSKRYYIIFALFVGAIAGVIINGIWGHAETELALLGYTRVSLFQVYDITVDREYLSVLTGLAESAVIIAFIAIAQAMIMINELKLVSDAPIDANKDIFAQGVANVSGVFFGAFAGGGSFNRTRLNLALGSKTKLSSMVSSISIVLIIWLFSGVIAYIPLAAMSGLLFLVGLEMVKLKTIKKAMKRSMDRVVFLSTLAIVMLIGLDVGIMVAFAFSVLTFVSRISNIMVEEVDGNVQVKGCLFFGTLDDLLMIFHNNANNAFTLDLSQLAFLGPGPASVVLAEQKRRASGNSQMHIIPPKKWCAGYPSILISKLNAQKITADELENID